MSTEELDYNDNEEKDEKNMAEQDVERAPSAPAPAPSATVNFDKLLTALEALPEQTALAVRAAMPKPSKPRPPEPPSESRTEPPSATPAKRTFADWWFGR